jgi:hypothetical protein
MKMICAWTAIALVIAFTAVNLFIPYALVVFGLAIGMGYFLGIPCGLLTRGRKGECRLGYCR